MANDIHFTNGMWRGDGLNSLSVKRGRGSWAKLSPRPVPFHPESEPVPPSGVCYPPVDAQVKSMQST